MTSSGRALLIAVVVCTGLAGFVGTRIVALLPAREATVPRIAAPQVAEPAGPRQAATSQPATPPSQARLQPEQPMAPRFDVVRVGVRGVAVVAGRANPGAEVLLLEDGREIGRGRADPRGEWVILPSEPLPPGSRQFSLLARAGGGEIAGTDVVVVAVPVPTAAAPRPDPAGLGEAERRAQAMARLEQARNAAETASAEAARATVAREAAAREAEVLAEAAQRESEGRRRAEAAAESLRRQEPRAATDRAEANRHAAALAAAVQREQVARERAEVARLESVAAEAALTASARHAAELAAVAAASARRAEAMPPPAASQPLVVLLPQGSQPPRVLQGPVPRQGLALGQVDYDDGGAIRFAGTAQPNAVVRVYVNDRHAGDTQADGQGRWALAPEERIRTGRHRLRLDQIAAAGAVAARIEVPFQRDDVADGAVPRDRVVVQPGDSLWRLARASYGEGTRFTLIFEANREQIRDADLIFPGQVFALPEARPADSSRSR